MRKSDHIKSNLVALKKTDTCICFVFSSHDHYFLVCKRGSDWTISGRGNNVIIWPLAWIGPEGWSWTTHLALRHAPLWHQGGKAVPMVLSGKASGATKRLTIENTICEKGSYALNTACQAKPSACLRIQISPSYGFSVNSYTLHFLECLGVGVWG